MGEVGRRIIKALMARADANTKVLADWKAKTPWIDFLA
jgi:phosphoserine aminotransferase